MSEELREAIARDVIVQALLRGSQAAEALEHVEARLADASECEKRLARGMRELGTIAAELQRLLDAERAKALEPRIAAMNARRAALREAAAVCRRGTADGGPGWSWRMDCAEELEALADPLTSKGPA